MNMRLPFVAHFRGSAFRTGGVRSGHRIRGSPAAARIRPRPPAHPPPRLHHPLPSMQREVTVRELKPVPLRESLALYPGLQVFLTGVPRVHAHRFALNLTAGPDVAFHFNPRFDVLPPPPGPSPD